MGRGLVFFAWDLRTFPCLRLKSGCDNSMVFGYTAKGSWCSCSSLLDFSPNPYGGALMIPPGTECSLSLLVRFPPSHCGEFAWWMRRRLRYAFHWECSHLIHLQPCKICRITRSLNFIGSLWAVVHNADLLFCFWRSPDLLCISLISISPPLNKRVEDCVTLALRCARRRQIVIDGLLRTCDRSAHYECFLNVMKKTHMTAYLGILFLLQASSKFAWNLVVDKGDFGLEKCAFIYNFASFIIQAINLKTLPSYFGGRLASRYVW